MLAKQTANFNRVEGMNVTENLLQAHPDVDAILLKTMKWLSSIVSY